MALLPSVRRFHPDLTVEGWLSFEGTWRISDGRSTLRVTPSWLAEHDIRAADDERAIRQDEVVRLVDCVFRAGLAARRLTPSGVIRRAA